MNNQVKSGNYFFSQVTNNCTSTNNNHNQEPQVKVEVSSSTVQILNPVTQFENVAASKNIKNSNSNSNNNCIRQVNSTYLNSEYLNNSSNIATGCTSTNNSWFSCDLADAVNSFIQSTSEYETNQMSNEGKDDGSSSPAAAADSNNCNSYVYLVNNCHLQNETSSVQVEETNNNNTTTVVSQSVNNNYNDNNDQNEHQSKTYITNESYKYTNESVSKVNFSYPNIRPSVSSETVSSTTIFYSGQEVNIVNSQNSFNDNTLKNIKLIKGKKKKRKCDWCNMPSASFDSGQGLRFHKTIRCPDRYKYLGK